MSDTTTTAHGHSAFLQLETTSDVEAVLRADGPQVLFLRDPWCPVSRDADNEMYDLGIAVPTIDVSVQHDLKQLVERETTIRHESPQVIVVRGGRPVWHASHYGITREAVARALAAD
ncbi:MAG TPA: monothiol bacilliredoxin BrxC family protein [Tepidiformaceae bacterium]|nr:monothiol bacilliredoxin BrxC family protein [Tepidiformaceae bacterium]